MPLSLVLLHEPFCFLSYSETSRMFTSWCLRHAAPRFFSVHPKQIESADAAQESTCTREEKVKVCKGGKKKESRQN